MLQFFIAAFIAVFILFYFISAAGLRREHQLDGKVQSQDFDNRPLEQCNKIACYNMC